MSVYEIMVDVPILVQTLWDPIHVLGLAQGRVQHAMCGIVVTASAQVSPVFMR